MTKRMIIALALSTVSGIALAQTGTPAEKSQMPAPTTMPSTSTDKMHAPSTTTGQAPAASTTTAKSAQAEKGLRMADSATLAVRFVTVQPAGIMSSNLIGVNVYNNQQESLGEVADLVIDDGKTITGVVVSVGGFLGLGESYVVMDPSTIVLSEKDGTLRAYVDTSKENLKSAPKFEYTKDKS